jgi:hypothetical protein
MSLASFDTPARSYRQHGSSVKRERERERVVSVPMMNRSNGKGRHRGTRPPDAMLTPDINICGT